MIVLRGLSDRWEAPIVVMTETILPPSILAETQATISGGPGIASTYLPHLVHVRARSKFDIGGATVGGVVAVVPAGLLTILLVRSAARNPEA